MNIWIIAKLVPYGRVVDRWSWDHSLEYLFSKTSHKVAKNYCCMIAVCRSGVVSCLEPQVHKLLIFSYIHFFDNFKMWRFLFSLPHSTDILVLYNFDELFFRVVDACSKLLDDQIKNKIREINLSMSLWHHFQVAEESSTWVIIISTWSSV